MVGASHSSHMRTVIANVVTAEHRRKPRAATTAGLVHGAVLPEHVLIQPDEHGLVLIDWCYSVPLTPSTPLRAPVTARAGLYPPEVAARRGWPTVGGRGPRRCRSAVTRDPAREIGPHDALGLTT
jgi:hypothetical protein